MRPKIFSLIGAALFASPFSFVIASPSVIAQNRARFRASLRSRRGNLPFC